jgi:hypothetical protein
VKHVNRSQPCGKCLELLSEGDPSLAVYLQGIRAVFPEAHVSCVWRGEAAQNAAVAAKLSRTPWPTSKHNNMKDGKPFSLAMDLFRLGDDGKAYFEKPYYQRVAAHLKSLGAGIEWGGDWASFPDAPHFQLKA